MQETETPITDAPDLSERDLISMLQGALTIRRARDEADGAYRAVTGLIRAWLDAHPTEQLRDGEARIVARLQEKRGSLQVDFMRLAGAHPALLGWAAQHGLLKLDATVWKALAEKAPEMLRLADFTFPGPGSQALIIEEER